MRKINGGPLVYKNLPVLNLSPLELSPYAKIYETIMLGRSKPKSTVDVEVHPDNLTSPIIRGTVNGKNFIAIRFVDNYPERKVYAEVFYSDKNNVKAYGNGYFKKGNNLTDTQQIYILRLINNEKCQSFLRLKRFELDDSLEGAEFDVKLDI